MNWKDVLNRFTATALAAKSTGSGKATIVVIPEAVSASGT